MQIRLHKPEPEKVYYLDDLTEYQIEEGFFCFATTCANVRVLKRTENDMFGFVEHLHATGMRRVRARDPSFIEATPRQAIERALREGRKVQYFHEGQDFLFWWAQVMAASNDSLRRALERRGFGFVNISQETPA